MDKKTIITIFGTFGIITVSVVTFVIVFINGDLFNNQNSDIIPQKVKISNISDDSFTVSWITDKNSIGGILYGTNDKLKNKAIDDDDIYATKSTPRKTHHVTISDLNPSSEYQFKIISDKDSIFDNQGSSYLVKTAPSLPPAKKSHILSGVIESTPGQAAVGSIVYIQLAQSELRSTRVKKDGSWIINLSDTLNSQLTGYAKWDDYTNIELFVQSGNKTSKAITKINNSYKIPKILLGQNYNFNNLANNKVLGTNDSGIYVQNEASVSITNPSTDLEEINTIRPQFLGKGPAYTVLSLTVEADSTYSGTTIIDSDGNWQYSFNDPFPLGTYTLKVNYSKNGEDITIERKFVITSESDNESTGTNPEFEATPSATIKPSASPRVAMPSTASARPVSGNETPTIIMLIFGLIILSLGIYTKIKI